MERSKAPARIIDSGRITIPADVRKNMDLERGDYVLIEVEPLERGDSA